MTSVKVAVRCRPFNQREKDRNSELICQMPQEGRVLLIDPDSGKTRDFDFDKAYWSHDGFKIDPET